MRAKVAVGIERDGIVYYSSGRNRHDGVEQLIIELVNYKCPTLPRRCKENVEVVLEVIVLKCFLCNACLSTRSCRHRRHTSRGAIAACRQFPTISGQGCNGQHYLNVFDLR